MSDSPRGAQDMVHALEMGAAGKWVRRWLITLFVLGIGSIYMVREAKNFSNWARSDQGPHRASSTPASRSRSWTSWAASCIGVAVSSHLPARQVHGFQASLGLLHGLTIILPNTSRWFLPSHFSVFIIMFKC